MRSKPASQSSPETGNVPDPVTDRDGERTDDAQPRAAGSRTEIELEVSRQRSIGWTIFALVLGALLIWKFGTVGRWAGFGLLAYGVYHAARVIQSVRYPAGTIVVSDQQVSLPRGVCLPRPVEVKPHEITAAYLLRRSVPWNHAAPVLVIEIGPRAMTFPRDWFASEADQRRVIHHLRAFAPRPAAEDGAGSA